MGLTGHALAMGGFAGGLAAFLVAAIAIAALVFSLAFAIARAQEETVKAISARGSQVKRLGGYILIAVGAWTLALAVFAEFFVQFFPV